jgi:hypothetical protein
MQPPSNWQSYCGKKVKLFSGVLLNSLTLPLSPLPVTAGDLAGDGTPDAYETGEIHLHAHEIDEMLFI